jgi:ComF family protein
MGTGILVTGRAHALRAIQSAVAVLFPVECAGCGEVDVALCVSCRRECGASVSVHRLACGTAVFAALRYDGNVRQAVLALKEHNRTDIARVLGRALAQAVDQAVEHGSGGSGRSGGSGGLTRLEIAVIPSTRTARRRRGYAPVRLLLSRAGFVGSEVLTVTGARAVQKGLTVAEREENRRGAFALTHSVAFRRFIIVDDVFTTGATLTAAVETIRQAGGEVVAVAVLAFTPRLFGGPAGEKPSATTLR